MSASERSQEGPGLVRALGLWDSTLLVIGLVVGSAVFMVTGGAQGVARLCPTPGWMIIAWVVGGIVSFAGALVYAELGAAMPRAGGQYVFLREAYGDLTGFLYGWALFTVIHTGTLAALAVGYAQYFGIFVPALGTDRVVLALPLLGGTFGISAGQIHAAVILAFLTIVNYFGVREGSLFQGVITIIKILSFAGFMALGLAIGHGSLDHFVSLFAPAAAGGSAAGAAAGAGTSSVTLGGFILAMVAMLWAYEGWNNITFTAGEIKDPQRNLPRALILGMTAITLIYVGMNVLYLYAMPVGDMPATETIGEQAAARLFGPAGARLMALAVLISVFGCISATVISGPRVFYAMAGDRLFFRSIATVHPRFRTPSRALIWQGIWSAVLCLTGGYSALYTYVMFAAVLFYALAGGSVIVLRRRHPEWPRPYRTWGYPLTPILFTGVCVVVLINTLVAQPIESVWGLLILALGLPAYFFWKEKKGRATGAAATAALVLLAAAIGLPAAHAAGAEAAAAPPAALPEPPAAPPGAGIHGFHAGSIAAQRALEAKLLAAIDTRRIEAHAKILTSKPHLAGTPEGEEVARYIEARFREAGLEVSLRRYPVYLGYVKEAALEQVSPERRVLATPEDAVPSDPDSAHPAARLNWIAFSPSGDLTREVVYVNYARPEDFEALEDLGVEVRDRIVLARYFHGYRGGKLLEAEKRGAAALILFSDPADDGYVRGDVYPQGPWGPEGHIQRGSAVYDFLVPGDPLTPGWASLPKARRIRPEEASVLGRIPSLPISGRDALPILRALSGPVVPKDWQGGLPLTYHTGPGPSQVHLVVKASFETRPIIDVIGVLRGAGEPEKKIVLSNHHDAWLYGAADPASGTASMLELARAAGELARQGFRPRRSLVFGAWDAEEWTLTGSTEWGEEERGDLAKNGVACLNVDVAASGSRFQASAVPTLRRAVIEALRDVLDPETGRSLREVSLGDAQHRESFRNLYEGKEPPKEGAMSEVPIDILGSGSDYTVFFNHIGMPAIDAGFDGDYGVYHSVYDNHTWMSRFGDPGFAYHAAMARVWGLLAYRIANADLLPFEESPYPAAVRRDLESLEPVGGAAPGGAPAAGAAPGAGAAPAADLAGVEAAIAEWEKAAADLDRAMAAALAGPRPAPSALAAANRALMKAERDLLSPKGIPKRPWYRHLLYAPLPTYAAETLPGLREALADHDADRARAQAATLAAALRARAATISDAAKALAR